MYANYSILTNNKEILRQFKKEFGSSIKTNPKGALLINKHITEIKAFTQKLKYQVRIEQKGLKYYWITFK